jgi:hypothetical protein
MSEEQPLSPWKYKPWWCQPWSILLTGVTIIGVSWLLFKIIWLTVVVSLPVLVWMGFFLLIWPKLVLGSSVLAASQEGKKNRVNN